MNWTAIGVAIAAVVALGAFYAWLTKRQEDALIQRMESHHEYQREKFGEIGRSMDRIVDTQNEHVAQLADHDKRLAVVETIIRGPTVREFRDQ